MLHSTRIKKGQLKLIAVLILGIIIIAIAISFINKGIKFGNANLSCAAQGGNCINSDQQCESTTNADCPDKKICCMDYGGD